MKKRLDKFNEKHEDVKMSFIKDVLTETAQFSYNGHTFTLKTMFYKEPKMSEIIIELDVFTGTGWKSIANEYRFGFKEGVYKLKKRINDAIIKGTLDKELVLIFEEISDKAVEFIKEYKEE